MFEFCYSCGQSFIQTVRRSVALKELFVPYCICFVKFALSDHPKIDKTKVLMTDGSLMKVKSIAEFCITFDRHYVIMNLENQFLVICLRGRLR